MTRVLVADDHSLFRDGIISLLEAAGFEVVAQVGDGHSAVAETLRLQPELVLLDITMPQATGLEALHQIKKALPEINVVMLTVSDDDADLLEAVKSGANGYLLKSLTAEEFLDMLNGLQRGEAAMTRQTTARLLKSLTQPTSRMVEPGDKLTPRELELLVLVAEGMSNRAIAQTLSVSPNTVKYHMKNILQKLNVQNRTEAVSYAIGAGLLEPRAVD